MEEGKFYYSDLFKKIANRQKILLNEKMSEGKITYVQSLVILYLLHVRDTAGEDYAVSQKAIENYLSLKGSTVTYILKRMEDNGFITREKSETDSRMNCICPTEKGISYVPLFFSILDGVEDLMTKGMNESEKELLRSLLQKVLTNLEHEHI